MQPGHLVYSHGKETSVVARIPVDPPIVVRSQGPFFARIPHEFARNSAIGDKAFRLWIVLRCYADWTTDEAFPTIGTLAKAIGCSRPTIFRAQKELVALGYLSTQSGKQKGEPNVYTVIDFPEGVSPVRQGVSHPRDTGVSHPRDTQQEPIERDPINEENDDAVVALCEHLSKRVEKHRGHRPSIGPAWTKHMRLLLERGPKGWDPPRSLDPKYVRGIIDGLFDLLAEPDRNGFCWADQVRSPDSLRRHFDQILVAGRNKLKLAQRDPLRTDPHSVEQRLFDNDPLGRSHGQPLKLTGDG